MGDDDGREYKQFVPKRVGFDLPSEGLEHEGGSGVSSRGWNTGQIRPSCIKDALMNGREKTARQKKGTMGGGYRRDER